MIPKSLQDRLDRLAARPQARERMEKITRELCDQGRLVEAGWQTWQALVMSPYASQIQRVETQRAFYAGAEYLFDAIMMGLEPDAEPTDADMRRMSQVHAELKGFFRGGAA